MMNESKTQVETEVPDGNDVFDYAGSQVFGEIMDLKAQIGHLEVLLAKSRLEALELMQSAVAGGVLKTPRFCLSGMEFTVKPRRTYAYSEEIVRAELRLKKMKDEAVKTGAALEVKCTEFVEMRATSLIFRRETETWVKEPERITEEPENSAESGF